MKVLKGLLASILILSTLLVVNGQGHVKIKDGPVKGKDAYIMDFNKTYNGGSRVEFMSLWGTTSGNPFIGRSLIEFDLSSIPAGANIDSAKISLYGNVSNPSGAVHTWSAGPNTALLQRITSSWSESTVNWNTMPTTTSVNEVTLAGSTSSGQHYINVDITDLIKDIFNNPSSSHGMLFKQVTENGYRGMVFQSSDAADSTYWPELDVYYTCEEIVPTIHLTYCPNDSVLFKGKYYSSPTVFKDTVSTTGNCDSIYQYEVKEKVLIKGMIQSVGPQLYYSGLSLIFQWFDCDLQSPISGAIYQSFAPEKDGNYAVIELVNGCLDTTDCFFFQSTGIGDIESQISYRIYPNPVSNQLFIEYGSEQPGNDLIQIYSIDGKIVLEKLLNDIENLKIDLSGYNSGKYMVVIKRKNELVHSELIVKL